MTKIHPSCFYCGQAFERRHGALFCWPCQKQRELAKGRASHAVQRAMREGELAPADTLYCVDCGGFSQVYDHRDYGKPLAVDPVCRSCNHVRGPAAWTPQQAAA